MRASAIVEYRASISRTRFCSAVAAIFGLVITGVSRCGIDSYGVSSTCLGSTSTMRTSCGVAESRMLESMPLMQADLPAPVVPATSRCGILARSTKIDSPSTSLPSQTLSGEAFGGASPNTSPSRTIERLRFGTSTPTAVLPGIGARMRMSVAASA